MKQIDWDLVIEELRYNLRQKMQANYAYELEGAEHSPYTFDIFDLQERIGAIEQGNYEEAYNLLVEEFGEEYFDDFLLK